jgi:hypothetical protein
MRPGIYSGSTRTTVRILALLLLGMACLPGLSASVDEKRFAPFIEKHANGWIDWDNGLIYGVGRGYLSKNRNNRPLAQGVADVLASGNIVKLAAGIHLDDAKTLETLGGGRVTLHLEAFLKDKPRTSTFVDDPTDPYYEVIKVADMKGVSGLTAKLLDHFNTVPAWRDFPIRPLTPRAELDDTDQPWLVLDARGLANNEQVQPAVFPKIISETGEILYELQTVEQAALLNRGMIRYVTSDEPLSPLSSDQRAIDRLLAQAGIILGVAEARAAIGEESLPVPVFLPAGPAAPRTTPRKRRERYIVKDVQTVQGLAKTNLVISARDAAHLRAEDSSSRILRRCRVLVIVSSPIGGSEGKLPGQLALTAAGS